MMESAFKIWITNRNIHLSFLENYTQEQLNNVPNGFSNNLIWNIGHIIVVQQRLVYKASNLSMNVSNEMFDCYKPGTKPTKLTTQLEVNELRRLLISLIDQTRNDFEEGKFILYNEFTTGTGFHLASIKDAIEFNNYHEALHLGFMMNIRKFV